MYRKPILSLCLNTAWQKILFFPDLALGEVNRARRLLGCGGGKGTNLARALRRLDVPVAVAGFAGGSTGVQLRANLQEEGVEEFLIEVASTTRTCTTVVDEGEGSSTELIEPSGTISSMEVAALLNVLQGQMSRFSGLAVCGTYPPGVPEELYAEIAALARGVGIPILLDGYKNVDSLLAAGVEMLKINAGELRVLGGGEDLAEAAQACLQAYPAVKYIAVTDGPRPACLFARGEVWSLPQVEIEVRNAIGAGDCCSGVLLHELLSGKSAVEAFASALGASTASCLEELPSDFDPQKARKIGDQILASAVRLF